MIPLRDDVPSRSLPFIVCLLIAACALSFFYTLALPSQDAMERLVDEYAVIPAQATGHMPQEGAPLPVRLVGSLFLHAGWLHIAGNMLFLWVFGDNVEDALGHGGFLLFYLVCGAIAGSAHILANPLSTDPTIGASGAISGVLGGYLLLYPRARVLCVVLLWVFIRLVWVPVVYFLPLWAFIQLYSGVSSLGVTAGGGVAWWAHVGGFAGGIILVRLFAAGRPR